MLRISFASFTASGIYSIPITFWQYLEIKFAIVPIPVYRSYTISLPFRLEKFKTTLYNVKVYVALGWKNDLGPILN